LVSTVAPNEILDVDIEAVDDHVPALGSYNSVEVDAPPRIPLNAITFPLGSFTMENPPRALPMFPVDDHVPELGLYKSHPLRYVVPEVPPHASTEPLPSRTAPKSARALLIDPVVVHVFANTRTTSVTLIAATIHDFFIGHLTLVLSIADR